MATATYSGVNDSRAAVLGRGVGASLGIAASFIVFVAAARLLLAWF